MITWVLFILLIENERYFVMPQGHYLSESDCADAQVYFLATAPKPQINYGSVCVKTDEVTMQ